MRSWSPAAAERFELYKPAPVQISSVPRYLHTLRYLRASQLLARVSSALVSRKLSRVPELAVRSSKPLAQRPSKPDSFVAPDQIRLLSITRRLDSAAWRDESAPRLWRYQLHYFDDLCGVTAATRVAWHRSLLDRWVNENAPCTRDAWDPYPTSLRIVNWIHWTFAGNELSDSCRRSLALQAEWLSTNVEYHLLANHVFENGKALVYAGLFFTGDAAERWLRKGWEILREEIPEQVLADGGHYERSAMYHAIILEGLLDLVNVARAYDVSPPIELAPICSRMLNWLRVMTHPDGAIVLFNDATLHGAPDYRELASYAARLGIDTPPTERTSLSMLKDSGYARIEVGPAVCIVDAAPLGPDYQPAHGHADTLTFELSLRERRVIVDTGVSTYEVGAVRERERSTAAHNTWRVDGTNSSDVWAAFRVGRRAKILEFSGSASADGVTVRAAHDGYRWLRSRVVHRRDWIADEGGLTIHDKLEGDGKATLSGALHFHPGLRVAAAGEQWSIQDERDNRFATIEVDRRMTARVETYQYAPDFGQTHDAQALRLEAVVALPFTTTTRVNYAA